MNHWEKLGEVEEERGSWRRLRAVEILGDDEHGYLVTIGGTARPLESASENGVLRAPPSSVFLTTTVFMPLSRAAIKEMLL